MPVPMNGAQRASGDQPNRFAVFLVLALILGSVGLAAHPTATIAAAPVKVVIVVGPVEGSTAKYISNAKYYAALARSYGASVTEVYSPNAT